MTVVLGKEISLDLGGFRNSTQTILPFLTLINSSSNGSSSGPVPEAPVLTDQAGLSLPILKVEFERTLRYVDIPVPDLPAASNATPLEGGRAEVGKVLEWLRSNQVTDIYELRVRDSLYLPHSEGMVFSCLQDFNVEVLDWMRVDLSYIPLKDTCPNLKELTLYAGCLSSWQYWTSEAGYNLMGEAFPKVGSAPRKADQSSY